MGDSVKKPDPSGPEATLVEADDVTGEAPLPPNAIPTTPVGKRPTHAAGLPSLREEPPAPRRITGKRPAPHHYEPLPPPVPELVDGATSVGPAPLGALPEPPTTVGPMPERSRAETKPIRGFDGPESSKAVTTPVRAFDGPVEPPPLPPFTEQDTRLNPLPSPKKLGPGGTLDTDSNPAAVGAGATLPGDEAGQGSSPSNPGAVPPPVSGSNPNALGAGSTQDFSRPTRSFTGLDGPTYRRAVWGLAGGGVLLVVLVFVWAMAKFDEEPPDVGRATPLATKPAKGSQKEAVAAPEVPRAVMIEQTVDAGNGETRTVLAAAGTIRIVTDPDCNVWVDGRDLGMAPVLVTLPAGKNSLVLENKKLFFKRTVSVNIEPNGQTAQRFAFSQGWIELDAPKDAKITIDGRPASGTHVQVWEGPHKVEATHGDKKKTRQVKTAEVAAGMTTSVHFEAPSIADD